ncbi:MAG: peptide chain release factor N(5)-glutamine methyltransferase [Candidatus Acidiferrales bacterium]
MHPETPPQSDRGDRDVGGALKDGVARLREAAVPSYTLAAEVLLMHATARDRAWLFAHPEHVLEAEAVGRYFALIERRAAGEPTQYLTGKQEFWGLEFEVAPGVLIPRPETEHLMEVALARLGERGLKIHMDTGAPRETMYVADVGTGSGCLAVALAYELPHAKIYATDISAAALAIARRNAEKNGVADRVTFFEADLLTPFLGADSAARADALPSRFDVIVSNPPYISHEEKQNLQREVRDHEPSWALFGGATGLELYAPIVEQASTLLRDRGILVLELGHDADEYVRRLFDRSSGWTNVSVTMDLAGIPRVLAAQRSR